MSSSVIGPEDWRRVSIRVALNGELSLHGVTQKPAGFRASDAEGRHSAGRRRILPSPERLRYSPVSAAGGTVKLKDELKLSFDISARKAKGVVAWPFGRRGGSRDRGLQRPDTTNDRCRRRMSHVFSHTREDCRDFFRQCGFGARRCRRRAPQDRSRPVAGR